MVLLKKGEPLIFNQSFNNSKTLPSPYFIMSFLTYINLLIWRITGLVLDYFCPRESFNHVNPLIFSQNDREEFKAGKIIFAKFI